MSGSPAWSWEDIERWAKATGRLGLSQTRRFYKCPTCGATTEIRDPHKHSKGQLICGYRGCSDSAGIMGALLGLDPGREEAPPPESGEGATGVWVAP